MSKQHCVRPQSSISISASFMCTKKDNIVCVIYVSENQLLILFGKGSQSAIFYRNMTEMFIYVVGWSAITTVRDRKILERERTNEQGLNWWLSFLCWILILFLNSWEIPFWLLFHPFAELSSFILHAFIIIKIDIKRQY